MLFEVAQVESGETDMEGNAMTRYERAKIAEFYGQAVADILGAFLSAAEEKEKCRPGTAIPKAAENKPDERSCLHNSTEGARCQDEINRECVKP